MCKSKRRSDGIEPNSTSATSLRPTASSRNSSHTTRPSRSSSASAQNGLFWTSPSATPISSPLSTTTLSSFRLSLSQNPLIFSFSEICSATANFAAGKLSSAAWRCSIRGTDVLIFQRKLRRPIEPHHLHTRLSLIGRAHYNNLVKLIGASRSDEHVYLVYEHVQGSNLATCLRNPKNPHFTILSTWISRMQIATDVAHGLDYIHSCDGSDSKLIHNHIKSSSIVVTEPSFNAKICHFATAELCGETSEDQMNCQVRELEDSESPKLKRSVSQSRTFEGTRGYMSPEFKSSGVGSQKSDVFAFGVVMLELLSGEEPLKYEFERARKCYRRISVIETAREVMEMEGEDEQGMRVRSWIDRRLKDSFPVMVARKMTKVALECVHMEPEKRPTMSRVAVKISKLFLESKIWSQNIGTPSDPTLSFAPR
ncbi:LysM domain receptor-like kinase 3 [Vitis vinifera]|uniref:LysM domain receptor-like kinase 3 n=1 Tax=Vitis vinifera TaxID=29760 RepID=A0A438D411_VITVI|nr:LysM domain receptor-like kinase 3 [Vitis vinifera]